VWRVPDEGKKGRTNNWRRRGRKKSPSFACGLCQVKGEAKNGEKFNRFFVRPFSNFLKMLFARE